MRTVAAVCLAVCAAKSIYGDEAAPQFHVQFSPEVHAQPYSGRVYLFFSKERDEPRTGPSWFNPELFAARDVRAWRPGEPLEFSPTVEGLLSFPKPLADMRLEGYRAQAVIRFNPHERQIGKGPGNGYSQVIEFHADRPREVLLVDKLVRQPPFRESKWCKLLRVRSRLLSDFHRREVFLQAAVLLPAAYYDQPERHFPTIFNIPGFGGTHYSAQTATPVEEENREGVQFLRLLLDPSCPLGHHVFADSANNGPVGRALIEEFIPEFDRQYRSVSAPAARFLTGHSSGGWSSLWLQVTYPDDFGGTWSTAPDPVDFRDFQRINLYQAGENMYVDAEGNERPLARRNGQPVLWYRQFAKMEHVLGYGGQLHSFEAVFSPRGDDGTPQLVWDRATGRMNTDVAHGWKKYDLRRILEQNWESLGPRLKGKLHVFMGADDTFYLEGATQLLKESLEDLGSDAVVEIHPGRDHSSLLTTELRQRIRREMTDAFLRHHPQ